MPTNNPLQIGDSTSIDVTGTTDNVELPGPHTGVGWCVMLSNGGSVPVFFKLGDSAVEATDDGTDAVILPGAIMLIGRSITQTHLAAITASSTATLYISAGYGA